ncbi:hypothetical protein ACWF94_14740 [Streptomyces sp. NPDC055078]
MLLDGRAPGETATATGCYDQSHLTRHFKRILGVPPRPVRPHGIRNTEPWGGVRPPGEWRQAPVLRRWADGRLSIPPGCPRRGGRSGGAG